jgi:hypothetical protein
MKLILTVLVAAFTVVACVNMGTPATIVTSASPEAAFTCALRAVNELGFTVTTSERAGGLLRAEKRDGGFIEAFVGTAYYTELTVTVSPSPSGQTSLQVRPARSQQAGNLARSSTGMSVRGQDQALADSVARRCSTT